MPKPYRLPNPEKEPASFLVILYKTLKKVEFDNREWDKIYFARCMKRTGQLLDCLRGDVRKAAQCMRDLKDRFEGDGWKWTIETIVAYSFEWLADFDKVNDRDMLRGLAKAYEGSGAENLLKTPEDRPALAEAPPREPSEEERQEALAVLAKCKEEISSGLEDIPL